MNRDIGGFEIAYHKNGVEFTRESIHSGERNSMVVELTMMQFTLALQKWLKREEFIQDIFPTLDADTREFIQTGITPSEWADIFGPEETDTELNNAEVP
jgi:hypothetical protein